MTRRNGIVAIAFGVWFLIWVAVFTWFGVLAAQYRERLRVYAADFGVELTKGQDVLAQHIAAHDTDASAAVLKQMAATVSQKTDHAPQLPTVLGVHMGLAAERNRRAEIQSATKTYAVTLTEMADCLAYQQTLAHRLQVLSLKDAGDYRQIVDLANTWREHANQLQAEKKPQKFAAITAALAQKMFTAEAHIRAMADLHKQNDTAGFSTKRDQLAAIIASFSEQGDQVATVLIALDAQAAADFTKLDRSL